MTRYCAPVFLLCLCAGAASTGHSSALEGATADHEIQVRAAQSVSERVTAITDHNDADGRLIIDGLPMIGVTVDLDGRVTVLGEDSTLRKLLIDSKFEQIDAQCTTCDPPNCAPDVPRRVELTLRATEAIAADWSVSNLTYHNLADVVVTFDPSGIEGNALTQDTQFDIIITGNVINCGPFSVYLGICDTTVATPETFCLTGSGGR